MTWRLPCEVNCNSADISNRGFARWRQLFLLRTWSTVIWDGHFSGLQSVFIISYRAKGRCGLNQAYIYPISWRVPRTLCSGNDQGNEVSEEKYSKGEGERRNEFFSDFFRWCPTIFLAYTSIYSTDIEPTTRFYSNSSPPPHLLPLYTEPEICLKQMCVNVSLSTWLLSCKNSILALSHILPTMQQPFSLQNEKN